VKWKIKAVMVVIITLPMDGCMKLKLLMRLVPFTEQEAMIMVHHVLLNSSVITVSQDLRVASHRITTKFTKLKNMVWLLESMPCSKKSTKEVQSLVVLLLLIPSIINQQDIRESMLTLKTQLCMMISTILSQLLVMVFKMVPNIGWLETLGVQHGETMVSLESREELI